LLSRIAAVTPDDAMRAAERVLSQPMTTTVLGPVDASIGRTAR
jgi:predicted Zn-dependent peptidase